MKTLLEKLGLINLNSLFLSVGYILFHIGREDKLSKRIGRAFGYSKFLLSYEIYLKYTNWKLFEVHLLFFFGLTDIQFSSVQFSHSVVSDSL